MRTKPISIARRNNLQKYRSQGNTICVRNAPMMTTGESFFHYVVKSAVCYALLESGQQFITEAIIDKGSKERADVIALDNGRRYEIETEESRARRFDNTGVKVIKAWEMKGWDLESILKAVRDAVADGSSATIASG